MRGSTQKRSPVPAHVTVIALSVALVSGPLGAAETAAAKSLVVGTKEAPPFAMKNGDGTWTGISIDLWAQIADELGVTDRFEERDLPGLVKGVETGEFDAAVAALTVTPERESRVDFTHPFYTTGLGVGARAETEFSQRLQVIPRTFQRQDYAIALPAGSLLREDINRLLVKRIQQTEWQDTLFKYIGQLIWPAMGTRVSNKRIPVKS